MPPPPLTAAAPSSTRSRRPSRLVLPPIRDGLARRDGSRARRSPPPRRARATPRDARTGPHAAARERPAGCGREARRRDHDLAQAALTAGQRRARCAPSRADRAVRGLASSAIGRLPSQRAAPADSSSGSSSKFSSSRTSRRPTPRRSRSLSSPRPPPPPRPNQRPAPQPRFFKPHPPESRPDRSAVPTNARGSSASGTADRRETGAVRAPRARRSASAPTSDRGPMSRGRRRAQRAAGERSQSDMYMGIEEPAVLRHREAVGHAGDVVGDRAGLAVRARWRTAPGAGADRRDRRGRDRRRMLSALAVIRTTR